MKIEVDTHEKNMLRFAAEHPEAVSYTHLAELTVPEPHTHRMLQVFITKSSLK